MQNSLNQHILWHQNSVTRAMRENTNRHKSVAIWLTGLSGAGKSTVAQALEQRLFDIGCRTYVLDGDNVRHGLCKDLSFSDADRSENIRRIGEVSRLLVDAGMIAISAFISPFIHDRDAVRSLFNEGDFIEVYCNADIRVCEERDVKGLYVKARRGLVQQFTGISSPYEVPINPELVLDTANTKVEACIDQVLGYLVEKQVINRLLSKKLNST